MPKVVDDAVILEAAIKVLVAHGYEGATTHKIAELAGVNEVTIFRRYGSKAQMFEKAIDDQLADTPLNELAYSGRLEADLLAIVEAYIDTNEAYGDLVPILLVEVPRNPELQGAFETPWRNLQTIIDIIRAYQEQGLLKAEPPLSSLSALIGPIMVRQMIRRANLELQLPGPDPRGHVEAFLRGRAA